MQSKDKVVVAKHRVQTDGPSVASVGYTQGQATSFVLIYQQEFAKYPCFALHVTVTVTLRTVTVNLLLVGCTKYARLPPKQIPVSVTPEDNTRALVTLCQGSPYAQDAKRDTWWPWPFVRSRSLASGFLALTPEDIAQLVRVSACHAEGRGFESRCSRKREAGLACPCVMKQVGWAQRTQNKSGKVAERFMATDCKSVDLFIVGSNPAFPNNPWVLCASVCSRTATNFLRGTLCWPQVVLLGLQ